MKTFRYWIASAFYNPYDITGARIQEIYNEIIGKIFRYVCLQKNTIKLTMTFPRTFYGPEI